MYHPEARELIVKAMSKYPACFVSKVIGISQNVVQKIVYVGYPITEKMVKQIHDKIGNLDERWKNTYYVGGRHLISHHSDIALYEELKELTEQHISAGKTMTDIANKLGVNVSIIRKVRDNEKYSTLIACRIKKAVYKDGYYGLESGMEIVGEGVEEIGTGRPDLKFPVPKKTLLPVDGRVKWDRLALDNIDNFWDIG